MSNTNLPKTQFSVSVQLFLICPPHSVDSFSGTPSTLHCRTSTSPPSQPVFSSSEKINIARLHFFFSMIIACLLFWFSFVSSRDSVDWPSKMLAWWFVSFPLRYGCQQVRFIVPVPYVKQVKLSTAGGRIIVSSDGIWDALKRTLEAVQVKGL